MAQALTLGQLLPSVNVPNRVWNCGIEVREAKEANPSSNDDDYQRDRNKGPVVQGPGWYSRQLSHDRQV